MSYLSDKRRFKHYKKQNTIHDNGKSHDQGESKLNSTIIANSGANTLTSYTYII